ncbi:subtilisin-like protein [Apiospora saccharicola]
MQLFFIEALVALAALTAASPASKRGMHHVTHERRHTLPAGWTKREKIDGRAVIPLRIGLKQRNLDRADKLLDEVSNPKSGKYAQHWTSRQIADMFAPSQESVDSVSDWLAESDGIDPSRIVVSNSKAWIDVNATVSEVESLIKTKYHVYEHSSTGHLHFASGSYSVPAYLSADHIDLIMPTLHFDAKATPGRKGSGDELRKRQDQLRKRHTVWKTLKRAGPYSGAARTISGPNPGSHAKLGAEVAGAGLITDEDSCDIEMTPECLRSLYELPLRSLALPNNSYGIVAYTPNSYRAADLDYFFNEYATRAVGERPILDSIDGGSTDSASVFKNLTGGPAAKLYAESSLDLEYAMALVYPQKVTLFQVGDQLGDATFNNFLDALDPDYCPYEGGDDRDVDGVYPNPNHAGYQGPKDCGTSKATNVISSSYGYNEGDLTPAYQRRQCYEYLKLGLRGVTVLYASGDFGVAAYNETCLTSNGTYIHSNAGRFGPSFPANCPYVTAVGATQVPTGTNIIEELANKVQPEVACEMVIRSGGGFSDVFEMPAYQAEAVTNYLTTYPPPFGGDRYNNSGCARGFPDVSANGAHYVIGVLGRFRHVFGTSASSPTFGAVITLINERRLAAGKKGPVGFLNPVLYANPHVLNDVTRGANPGCGTGGFGARPGWDPVTGLGTPNFPRMLDLFVNKLP